MFHSFVRDKKKYISVVNSSKFSRYRLLSGDIVLLFSSTLIFSKLKFGFFILKKPFLPLGFTCLKATKTKMWRKLFFTISHNGWYIKVFEKFSVKNIIP